MDKKKRDAISRMLSPLEHTAAVAGLKSTREPGMYFDSKHMDDELTTREIDKRLQQR